MRITLLFGLYAAAFVILISGLTVLTLRNIEQSRLWDERSELAHASLEEHLKLQSKVFQLLKQHGDALIIGDRDRGARERELKAKIAETLSRIRTIIGLEIELVGEEEIEELEFLNQLERQIASVTRALTRMTPEEQTAEQIEKLADLLDRTIDEDLSTLIQNAVEEEAREVAETRAEAQAFRQKMRLWTWATASVALLVLLLGVRTYFSLLHAPFRKVMEAVKTYGTGDFSKDIRPSGGHELREMSTVLSEMAALLRQREQDQKQQSDTLERKVAERTKELEKLLGQIEMSEANRRRMMADISHELRTPLTIIRGEAEVALRGTFDDAAATSDAFARIRDSARHTTQIVDDMLLIARHEAGELRLDPKDTDLRQVIADARDLFDAPLIVTIEATETVARIDRLRMRQCLLSVLHNAQRYGGPEINITLRNDAQGLTLAVCDNGPGMSDEDKAQAFERFFRGSNAAHAPKEGTGLGLPIVRAIMAAHGGDASLQDGPDGGLCVILTLPRRKPISIVATGEATPKRSRR